MIIRRWDDQAHGGRAKVYPQAWSEDWFFFFSVLLCLTTEAFGVVRTATIFLFISLIFFFFSPSPSFLEVLLCYISPSHWSGSFICWSCRLLLECLSHLSHSSTCCELQQTRWYCSWVIFLLMRTDCQLQVFNANVTTSLGIAPPPCPYSLPTVLVLLFGMPGRAVFEGVPLSSSMTLVCWGHDCPRRCLLTVWTFLVHPRMFLFPWRGPWAWYEIGQGCQILRPHKF